MKKIVIIINLLFIIPFSYAQTTTTPEPLDDSILSLWNEQNNENFLRQNTSPESIQDHSIIAPLIPPARSRQIPGAAQVVIPVEASDGPLNLAPNDAQAYILYNRATIAYRKEQYERARGLYRDLIRRYPHSSYSPYALYTLSISEQDYLRKVRILLTIKERFPNFPHRNLIIDRIGDIYYILDSISSAKEEFSQSQSPYAFYMLAMIALDEQKPNRAIGHIRDFLNKSSNNEEAYQAYLLYAEALIAIRSYENALTVLQKATRLRPWAYDNGALILLHAGQSFYHSKRYDEALYAFSLLRLQFSRSTESRLADQYIVALSQRNIATMKTVPWLAESFNTIFKEQPIVTLRTPRTPSVDDILQMNTLPTAIPEPSLEGIAFIPPMPVPVPAQNIYDILVPITDDLPQIEIVTITNSVFQETTNTVEKVFTNRIFLVETNTFTNNIVTIDTRALTNVITNAIQIWETNTVVSYEPVVLWRTNYRNVDVTNLVTNVVDFVVTNEKVELLPLWKTNYNFVNRPRSITNVIVRHITNRYLELGLNNNTNWRTNITQRQFIEIIPAWKTIYNTLDTNQLITNTIKEIVTNRRLELVPRWIDNIRTNDTLKVVDQIITNTRLRIAPRWITNYQVIQTNMRDAVITNVQNIVHTNLIEQVITNLLNVPGTTVARTNITEEVLTNFVNVIRSNTVLTNFVDVINTNIITVVQTNTTRTNLLERVITNSINLVQTNRTLTNIIEQYITNTTTLVKTNRTLTNIVEMVVTNTINFIQTNNGLVMTNVREFVATNLVNTIQPNTPNISTNVREIIATNFINMVQPNRPNVSTNVREIIATNYVNMIQPNQFYISTNMREFIITNTVNITPTNIVVVQTNTVENIVTNIIERPVYLMEEKNTATPVELAPALSTTALSFEEDEAQIDFILEPIYSNPIEEEQIKLVSEEVAFLEIQAAKLAEKSAGIAGQYSFPDNKGYVVRVAQLKDLSVANIILKDINKLDLDFNIGIYYRDETYYIEIRAIQDYKKAKEISQILYQLGYVDVQMFEQFEVTEYQEEE